MSSTVTIDKRELLEVWYNATGSRSIKTDCVLKSVSQFYPLDFNTDPNVSVLVKKSVQSLCDYFKKLWIRHDRNKDLVIKNHLEFFNRPFTLPESILNSLAPFCGNTSNSAGRKVLPFEKCSQSTKRRRTGEVRTNYELSELTFATQMKLRESGERKLAAILKTATSASSSPEKELRSGPHSKETMVDNDPVAYTDTQALALLINTNMSKSQYVQIQSGAKGKNANIYPAYHRILAAKKCCYPSDESITVNDVEMNIQLQSLLDHTSSRIITANEEVLDSFTDEELLQLVLTVKWGMDGSTGNSEYNQMFDRDEGTTSDASIFITSLVPIQMDTNGKILFKNPRPSSTRLCRPVRIQLKSESSELTVQEKQFIEHQIADLIPTEILENNRTIRVSYRMLLTMVDGKVCSAVTETSSSQRCYICNAKPTEMNNIDRVRQRAADKTTFQYGLSTLHAWIRFFEYFLHVAYRLEIKKWRVSGEDKIKVSERKKRIQTKFKLEMGLNVDKPRAGGAGTSNTGNTARRFFANAEKTVEITGLDLVAVERCGAILQAMASGCRINPSMFEIYCTETARMLVDLYPWYYLPASVHKILIHGSAVINHFLVPIGQLSEEAQEARNKDWKRYRKNNTRKFSRSVTNRDLLNWLLVSSDPLITSIRGWPKKHEKPLSKDARSLLLEESTD